VADTKKRLPVLKQTPEEEQGEEARPPWHWVGFGTVVFVGAWLPLAYAADAIMKKLFAGVGLGDAKTEEEVALVLASLEEGERTKLTLLVWLLRLLPCAIGAVVGGYIVGRWGGDRAGVREAAIAGVLGTTVMTVLAVAQGGVFTVFLLIPVVIAGVFAAIGGKLGLRRRIKMLTPNMK
jgi:hypothetical protein